MSYNIEDPFETRDAYYDARAAVLGNKVSDKASDIEYIDELKARYEGVKEASVGTEVLCPVCNTPFVKKHPFQVFCKHKGSDNCKDFYWNRATPKRLERSKIWGK